MNAPGSPDDLRRAARALATVVSSGEERLGSAVDALVDGERRAAGLLDDLDATTRRATGLADVDVRIPGAGAGPGGAGPTGAAARVAAPTTEPVDDLASHPAVLDAERLVADQERARRRRARELDPNEGRTERQVTFILWFALFMGVGLMAGRLTGWLPGDAISRLQSAQATVAGRDPHLEALGFIWGPFPALFEAPLAALRGFWAPLTSDGIAAVIVSAAFMAGCAHQLTRWGVESGVSRWMRISVVTLTMLHALVWVAGVNGMSEACWVFFCIVAARRLATWRETDDVRHLAICGAAMGMAYLVRYETIAIMVGVTAFVAVVTYRRWDPRVDGRLFGEPTWDDDRERLQRTALDAVLVALPAVAAVALWALASWAIIGEPFPQFSSQYGNSALVKAAGGSAGLVADQSTIGRAGFYLWQVLVAAPGLVLVSAFAVWSGRRAALRYASAAVVFASPVLLQLVFSFKGSTFAWFRYAVGAVFLLSLAALTLRNSSAFLRVLAVGAVAAGVVTSNVVTWRGDLGVTYDTQFVHPLVDVLHGSRDPKPTSVLGRGTEVATYVDGLPDAAPGAVLAEAASSFPVLLGAPRPEFYVITPDRDFEPIANDPPRFGVRYILLADPAGASAGDALHRNFPGLWSNQGTPFGPVSLVKEWGKASLPRLHYKLYRVSSPQGQPRAHPAEEFQQ